MSIDKLAFKLGIISSLNRYVARCATLHEVALTLRERDSHPYKYRQNIKKKHKVHAPALNNEFIIVKILE